jgi:hypothetical protein
MHEIFHLQVPDLYTKKYFKKKYILHQEKLILRGFKKIKQK